VKERRGADLKMKAPPGMAINPRHIREAEGKTAGHRMTARKSAGRFHKDGLV
jgi:hypothetical protein